jgi:thioredoxin reductase
VSARVEADVVVVGGGPAGLAAAAHAAEGGRSVVLVERAPATGGQIWRSGAGADMPRAAQRWSARLARANVSVIGGAEVIDAVPLEGLTAMTAEGAVRVRSREIVLATGARELFLPFPGWTLPNVMGVGGLQAVVKAGYDVRGKRVVIAGSGPLLLPVAATLAKHGASLVLVAEQTPREKLNAFARSLWRAPWQLVEAARLRAGFWRTPYRPGTWVARASGDGLVREVTLTDGHREWSEPCDLLATGFGLVPNTELARWLGCTVDTHGIIVNGEQATTVPGVFAAGECTGVAGAAEAVAQGARAGRALASRRAIAIAGGARGDDARSYRARIAAAFAPRRELRALAAADVILCRCEDVRCGAVAALRDAREAKLHTRAGMGACQGRVCGAALEWLRDWPHGTVRAPLLPATVGALAALDDAGA